MVLLRDSVIDSNSQIALRRTGRTHPTAQH
jgi:hypothetical protein